MQSLVQLITPRRPLLRDALSIATRSYTSTARVRSLSQLPKASTVVLPCRTLSNGPASCIARPTRDSLHWNLSNRKHSGSSNSSTEPRIICETKEVSPGNNVATISSSNPRKLNIVNSPLLEQLIQTCQTLSKDPNLRAVILTGGPTTPGKAPSFIGGADIREMSQLSSSTSAKAFITRIHHACQALRAIPVPVIARIHGFCLGAGLEIAASCDLRIATRESVFGMPEVKIGLPSVVEAAYLPGLIGWGRTRRFLYLAENVGADVAEKWGLVEKVVEGEEALDVAVEGWTEMLVANGPKCVRAQKVLMQKWENGSVDEGIEAGVEAFAETFRDGGEEPRGLMQKFLSRQR